MPPTPELSYEVNQNPLIGVNRALLEPLGDARLALETFNENRANSDSLRRCLHSLQQLTGALEVLELRGAHLLTAEIEALGQNILAQHTEAGMPALEALGRSMVFLQGYLRYLEAGIEDHPLRVLAAINDLRNARGESPWLPEELFEPDLAMPIPSRLSASAITMEDAELRSLAARLRLQYEAALLAWFRSSGNEALPRLAQIITELRQHARRVEVLRLWWLAQGVIEALQEGGLKAGPDLKLLVGGLDRYIKILAQGGESALAASVPQALLKSLLFHLANAASSGIEVTAIQATYHLAHLAPADRTLPVFLATETIEAVLANLTDAIDYAKDQLDFLERSPRQSPQNLSALQEALRKLTGVLEALGFSEPVQLLQPRLEQLEHSLQKEATLSKEQRQTLAYALLQVESLLGKEAFFHYGEQGACPSPATSMTVPTPTLKRYAQAAQQATIEACLEEISAVMQALASLPTDSPPLLPLVSKLQQAAEALSVVGLERAAALLRDCCRCISDALNAQPTDDSLLLQSREALATALTAIAAYLDARGKENPANDSLLDTAAASLNPVLKQFSTPETSGCFPPQSKIEKALPRLEKEADIELQAAFLEEAEDLLQASQALLSAWQQAPSEEAPIAELLRKLHTLKGGAHLIGMIPMADLAHHIEALLSTAAPAAPTELLQRSLDRLWILHDQAQKGAPLPSVADLAAEISHFCSGIKFPGQQLSSSGLQQAPSNENTFSMSASPSPANPEFPSVLPPSENRPDSIKQIRIRADSLARLGDHATELEQVCRRMEHQVEMLYSNLDKLVSILGRHPASLSEPGSEVEKISSSTGSSPLGTEAQQNKPDINHLTWIQNTLRETAEEIDALFRQQAHLSFQFQQELRRTEWLPFAGIIPRLQRIVHHSAQELNKLARLEISGGEIEFKQTLLNRIAVPLEHLLRNSISHGIEAPSERMAAGKEKTGLIHLSLSRESAEILIRITDDGRGIDLGKVRATALAQGLIQAEPPPSDEHLMELILEPGFSTAEALSPLAGRGIGLDVVANEVQRLHGSLEIASHQGQGATFTLRLPYP